MNKYKMLAELQAEIWFLHDGKKFKELSDAASKLFAIIGFPIIESRLAGKYVSDAYFYYDKAGEQDRKGNKIKREFYFKKVLKEQIKIRRILDEDIRAAYYENNWWMKFHYRNYFGQFPYMLLQQIVKYKGYNIVIPLEALFYLVKAGLEGHNKRKMRIAKKYLEKYWEITLKHMKDKIQY